MQPFLEAIGREVATTAPDGFRQSQQGVDQRVGLDQRAVEIDTEGVEVRRFESQIGNSLVQPFTSLWLDGS